MATNVMLRQLAVVEPDAGEWDAFALGERGGHLLQSSPWGALKSRFGWSARRVAIAGPDGLVAGAQVLFRHRYGLAAAYVPRGPIFAADGDAAVDDLLLATLRRVARRQRAVFLRLEPNVLEHDAGADTLHTALLLRDWRPATTIQPRSSIHLDLTPTPETLFAAFSKGHRADIRRAERQGVTVRVGTGNADIAAFFGMMQATSDRKTDYGIHSEAYYRAAWELFAEGRRRTEGRRQKAEGGQKAEGRRQKVEGSLGANLFLAEHNGTVVGTCMVFAGGGGGAYLYGGSNEVGLKMGANHLLQWHAIKWAQDVGCTSYDLWGIPDPLGQMSNAIDDAEREVLEAEARRDPLYGVYRFKKGFGGQVVRYLPAYDQVYLPPLYALWRRRAVG